MVLVVFDWFLGFVLFVGYDVCGIWTLALVFFVRFGDGWRLVGSLTGLFLLVEFVFCWYCMFWFATNLEFVALVGCLWFWVLGVAVI